MELDERLRKFLIEGIKRKAKSYAILNMIDVNSQDSDYWITTLGNAEWAKLTKETKRFIENISLFQPNVSVQHVQPFLGIFGAIISDRSEIISNTIQRRKYEDRQKDISDFPYKIEPSNFKEWINILYTETSKQRSTEKIVFSVSTRDMTGKPCNRCSGTGKIPCETCTGKGWLICDVCHGVGEMEYQAGNYSNGEIRIKSKVCIHCGGSGKQQCPDCSGTKYKSCPDCHGTGKDDRIEQTVKEFRDIYKFISGAQLIYGQGQKKSTIVTLKNDLPKSIADSLPLYKFYDVNGNVEIDNNVENSCKDFNIYGSFQSQIKKETKHNNKKVVCLLGRSYSLPSITIVTIQTRNRNEPLIFYFWDELLWSTTPIPQISFGKLLLEQVKVKMFH